MAFNDRDLFHRRSPHAATTTTSHQKQTLENKSRRKRAGRSSSALSKYVILLTTPLGIFLLRTVGRGKSTNAVFPRERGDINDGPFVKISKQRLRLLGQDPQPELHNADEDPGPSEREFRLGSKLGHSNEVKSLYRIKFSTSELGYDVINCPSTPLEDYPHAWPITDVLRDWNPNDVTTIPPSFREVYHALCIFDYQTQYAIALAYRDAEKPFIIRNDPNVLAASKKWTQPNYLLENLPQKKTYTERSPVNHFIFYNEKQRKNSHKWVRPLNDVISMSYSEWLERALERDALAVGSRALMNRVDSMKKFRIERELGESKGAVFPDDDEVDQDRDTEADKRLNWYYWRLNADLEKAEKDGHSKMIFDDMPFFDPRKEDSSFYLVDPSDQRGINCRFGMRGVIAENHCDLSRNMISVLDGERRYILGHPNQCSKFALYPRGHPSGRHSSFDFSNPSNWPIHPEFKDAHVSEVVLKAGDTLYLPTAWFHYIVNLSANIQCNIRSGISYESADVMSECGFVIPKQ